MIFIHMRSMLLCVIYVSYMLYVCYMSSLGGVVRIRLYMMIKSVYYHTNFFLWSILVDK
jgi:hypothetical protein